jgi:RNA polymerase sigma factor (sigma-70 family)
MPAENIKQIRLNEAWDNFKSGDFNSLGVLFELHYQELFYYGIKIVDLPEMVKDSIQDLFADVWERRDKMASVSNFKAYLLISLRRELIRRVTKIRKEAQSKEVSTLQFSFSAEEFVISNEEAENNSQLLAESLASLTERQREVILLRFFHNLEFAEISQVLEMNIQSVRNLLFRALEKIRKDLANQGVAGVENVEVLLWSIFQQKN